MPFEIIQSFFTHLEAFPYASNEFDREAPMFRAITQIYYTEISVHGNFEGSYFPSSKQKQKPFAASKFPLRIHLSLSGECEGLSRAPKRILRVCLRLSRFDGP